MLSPIWFCYALVTIQVIAFYLFNAVTAYKPIVIIHGIFDHRDSLYPLMSRITEQHEGTNVTIVNKLHGWRSMIPLWTQVKIFEKSIRPIMEANPGGIHLIGFSQGGLIARGLIQSMMDHNVDTFVSLSSPQGGQYGDSFLKTLFPGYLKKNIWKLFYRDSGQHTSVGNFWKDPYHLSQYYKHCRYLPILDNEIEINDSSNFKNNFMRLKKLVIIGGPDDGVISPWLSSQFGTYENASTTVLQMEERDVYKLNLFGLRSLDEEGKIVKITVPGISHHEWHKNVDVMDKYIIPHLN